MNKRILTRLAYLFGSFASIAYGAWGINRGYFTWTPEPGSKLVLQGEYAEYTGYMFIILGVSVAAIVIKHWNWDRPND